MLEFERDRTVHDAEWSGPARGAGPFVDLSTLVLCLRQNAGAVLLVVACFCALGLGYVVTAAPLYTATAEILVDTRLASTDEEGGNRSLAELGMDAMSVDSQIAVLGSQKLAMTVLRRLHLENDDEFATPTSLPGVMLASLRHLIAPTPPELRDGIRADILDGFEKSIGVTRVQQTYVIKVGFTARNARRAAVIANTLVAAYSDAEIRSRMRARQISERYVQVKLDEVREKIRLANAALDRSRAGGDPQNSNDARRDLDSLQASYSALASQADSALQHQVTPITAVSILADARPPSHRSQPNTLLVLLLSAIGGCACAVGLTIFGELRDVAYRLPGQVEAALRLRYVGLFPKALGKALGRGPLAGWRSRAEALLERLPFFRGQRGGADLLAIDTLRAMKIAAEVRTHNDGLGVIGIVSAAGGEGQSSVAAAFADMIAKAGQRSLLVDADLHRPSLGRSQAPRSGAGLVDVLKDRAALDAAIIKRGGGADFLPARAHDAAADAATLHIRGLQVLLAEVSSRYDFVILDLPPLGTFTEAAALAPAIGAVFLVIEWGVTARSVVDAAINEAPLLVDRMAGFVFSKVDVEAFRRSLKGSRYAAHLGRNSVATRSF